jgi:uroporphyrinogen III methyltransferase / synthase
MSVQGQSPVTKEAATGRVYLVGGGPGDPGLITLRGVECLSRADVVVYDYLVNPRVLAHARGDVELVCLGRHGHGRVMKQDEINAVLVDRGRAGKTVVRLKGGDPAIFGHLGDEAAALAAAGVPFEVVPGVTAASAAASYAGVPLTHRDSASAVAFVAGHQRGDAEANGLEAGALAAFPGTLVIYMGVTTAAGWTRELIAAGKNPATPAAIVRRASLPDQERWFCRLDEVAARLAEGPIRPPVLVIVGEVARADTALEWFTHRPLFGKTVLITRAASQADELYAKLAELGANVLVQPAIEILPVEDFGELDRTIGRLGEFAWVVFSSANGVRYFFERLLAGGDLRRLGAVKLAAIGPGTAEALAEYHLRPDLMPGEYRAEALAVALGPQVSGKRALLVRASRGREVLAEQLMAAGAIVEQVVAYRSIDAIEVNAEILEAIDAGRVDWITVTSSAIARSLAKLLGERLRKCKLATISPLTTEALRELGYEAAAEAREYTMAGIVAAIIEWEAR